jgi:hypothetical protein
MTEPTAVPDRAKTLTGEPLAALQAWCRLHDIDPAEVPVEPARLHMRLDPETDEWLIPQFTRRDGKIALDESGDEVAWHMVRRPNRGELPWPPPRGYDDVELPDEAS